MGGCASTNNIGEPNKKKKYEKSKTFTNVKVAPDIFVSLKQGTLSEYYKIGDILGEGTYGCVRLGTHKVSNMVRAIKQINKSKILKEDEQIMFTEVDLLKQLDHPNIVKIYELYQDKKNYFLITEQDENSFTFERYLEGGELFERLRNSKVFTEKMAADYMKQILSAIAYCHERKIVHRDIKLENVLFESKSPNSSLKIIDFGTSRRYVPDEKLTRRIGTPYYMAPEVLLKSYNEKCDVWSCGVLLYILLCGYPPFTGEGDEVKAKIKEGKYEFHANEWGKISLEAKELISKMLSYNPGLRMSAVEALNDPWIQSRAPTHPINNDTLKNIQNFYSNSKWKSAISVFIVTQVQTNKEKEELLKQFQAMDKNNDGTISREELLETYCKIYDKTKAEELIEEILKAVDINNSGQIDFTEFLMASTQHEKLMNKERLEKVFKMFDMVKSFFLKNYQQDSNGKISKCELQQIMGGIDVDEEQWNNILEECDKDKDGEVKLSWILNVKDFIE